jgi:hypothetical protein
LKKAISMEANFNLFCREILLEEKVSDTETMKRENRRIAAMSWGGGESDEPPPKPSRTPMADSTSKLFQQTSVDNERPEGGASSGMTYIVAQDPAILAQLMRENEKRGINPSAYTTPASVFNVLAVDFNQATESKPTEEPALITSTIPAEELIPLQQDKIDLFEKCPPQPSSQPQSLIHIPSPQFSGTEADSESSYFPMSSPSAVGLPPQPPDAKSKSLERNLGQNSISTFTRISSLERQLQQADYSMKPAPNPRSQSLIRQYGMGLQQSDHMMRSSSLERKQQLPGNFKTSNSNTFEKFQNPPPAYVRPVKGGSLERSQAIIMNDLMRKYYDQKAANDASKPKSGGSLERNVEYQQYLLLQKQQLQQQLQAQQQQVQAQQQQLAQAQAQKQEEIIEENIYDFGGVHVKSCATIALKKSIERGMLPPQTMMCSPVYDSNSTLSSGPSSLDLRPATQQNIKPGIASRMMIFQQGSHQVRPPHPMNSSTLPKTFSSQNFYSQQTQVQALAQAPTQSEQAIFPPREPHLPQVRRSDDSILLIRCSYTLRF